MKTVRLEIQNIEIIFVTMRTWLDYFEEFIRNQTVGATLVVALVRAGTRPAPYFQMTEGEELAMTQQIKKA